MADFDDRVRNVLLEHLASVESQGTPENGEWKLRDGLEVNEKKLLLIASVA